MLTDPLLCFHYPFKPEECALCLYSATFEALVMEKIIGEALTFFAIDAFFDLLHEPFRQRPEVATPYPF
jgi:hypothetical protein